MTSGTGATVGSTISNNWNDGVGTVRYPNDPYDRGDLGLVQIPGGAVYYTDSNGQVHAKGVTSGGGSGCTGLFTEITDAVNALPGDVATR